MTFLDKLKDEYPSIWVSKSTSCPYVFGYEDEKNRPCVHDEDASCIACWLREVPPTIENHTTPTNDLAGIIVSKDGYTIAYYQNTNQIVITLPQTMNMLSNTTSFVWNQNANFTSEDLMILLELTRYLCER